MSASIADFHFGRRGRQSLRLLGYAALAAVYFYALHVSGEAFVIGVCVFAAPALLHYARSVRERHGDERPDWLAHSGKSAAERREFARLPYQNPFDAAVAEISLEERISEAAEASIQFGRRVSVVNVYAPGAGRATIEEAAAVARTRLRHSDYVEVTRDDELIVCVNMIRDMQNADLVLNRVRDALVGQGIDCADWRFGRAICPMHGYTGVDLIEAARRDSGATPAPKAPAFDPRLRLSRGGLAVVCGEE